jgi:hypothetical protein
MKAKIFFLLLFSGFFVFNTSACTIFSGIDNRGHVLISNNEDHIPNMSIFFKVRMATDSTYGYFGTIYNHPDGWLQGGSNDQGLFFDTNELGYVPLRKTAGRQPYKFSIDPGSFVLQNCKNVDEVVRFFNTYRIELPAQVHVADKSGRFAIINNDTIIYTSQSFQLTTNFHPLHHDIGVYPCWRYNAVTEIIASEGISPASFEKAMFASAQHGNTMSIYMNTGDLTTGDWTFYMFGFKDNYYKFNIRELLSEGNKTVLLRKQFNNHPYFKYDGKTGQEVDLWESDKSQYSVIEREEIPKAVIWNNMYWETNYKAAYLWLNKWWKEVKYPTAEDWMTRGLVQILNNYHDEAYKSFVKTLELDPSSTSKHYLAFLNKEYSEEGITFTLQGFKDAKVVSIGGLSMNPNYYLMHRTRDGWEIRIPELKGTIIYYFIVDGKKVMDPKNSVKQIIPTVTGPLEVNILVLK